MGCPKRNERRPRAVVAIEPSLRLRPISSSVMLRLRDIENFLLLLADSALSRVCSTRLTHGYYILQSGRETRECRPSRHSPIMAKAEHRASGAASSAAQCRSNPSPVAVSQKREYFKYPPETFGDFAPTAANFGAWRPAANSQKPAIGGPLCKYQG